MSLLGITRTHGTAETGASSNLTGVKSSFFSGYQPLFVKIQTVHATVDLVTSYSAVNSNFEKVIKAVETVGSVVGYGVPATGAGTDTVVVIVDGASINRAGTSGAGSETDVSFGNLTAALAGVAGNAGNYTITTYTGFSGASLA